MRRDEFIGQEFVQRVADRAIARESDATYGARVVLEVLEEATTGGLADTVPPAAGRREPGQPVHLSDCRDPASW